jgi:hypothetical protein
MFRLHDDRLLVATKTRAGTILYLLIAIAQRKTKPGFCLFARPSAVIAAYTA